MERIPILTIGALILVAFISGCAGAQPAEEEPTAAQPAEEEPTTETPAGEANTVQVELVSFAINMSNSIPAGPTTFEVTNTADIQHSFEIEGQGIEEGLESNLQTGETGTLEVDLEPGTYHVYCPVDGHAEQGMELQLTVTES